ncbi:hypothetical protein EUGRSUZ_H03063 [Eucalyptus grandis]|uniref:Uncharacterized protein n=2 Tax=Eucalyptus grandis TaxID=71139 RepID=A0ACC3JTH5_EUCGR|nr:hypothetical protein EUGRSUZ_H03063 [Eucalyptus grandis]
MDVARDLLGSSWTCRVIPFYEVYLATLGFISDIPHGEIREENQTRAQPHHFLWFTSSSSSVLHSHSIFVHLLAI